MCKEQRFGRTRFAPLLVALIVSACGGRADVDQVTREGDGDSAKFDAGGISPEVEAGHGSTSEAEAAGEAEDDEQDEPQSADSAQDPGNGDDDPSTEDNTDPETAEQQGSIEPSGNSEPEDQTPSQAGDRPDEQGEAELDPDGDPSAPPEVEPPDAPPTQRPPVDRPPDDAPPAVDPPVAQDPPVDEPPPNEPPPNEEPPIEEPPPNQEPPDPPEPDPLPPTPDPTTGGLWLAAEGPSGWLIDVSSSQQATDIELAWSISNDQPHANSDGSLTVALKGGAAYLVPLTPANGETTLIQLNAPEVIGWAAARLLIASGDVLYDASNPTAPVAIAPLEPNRHGGVVSPDGSAILYSSYDPDQQTFQIWSIILGTGAVTSLGVGYMSPALSVMWTSDSRYVAFGISQSDGGGIALWKNGTSDAGVFVSPPDTGYNPNYSFSPDGTRLLLHAAGDLLVVPVDAPDSPQLLGSPGTSPGHWSYDGQYVFYSSGTLGKLVPVAADGTFGSPLDVNGMTYGCSAYWVDAHHLLNRNCAVGVGALMLLEIGAESPPVLTVSTLVDDSLNNLDASPDGRCLANWNQDEIRLSSANDAAAYTTARQSPTGNMHSLKWAPDSSGVAWLESGDGAYFQAVADCSPTGTPVAVHKDATASSIGFIPR